MTTRRAQIDEAAAQTTFDGVIEQALDDVRAARRSVLARIDDDTPDAIRRCAQISIDDLDATERDLMLVLQANDAAGADAVVDVRRSLEETDLLGRRWFAQLRNRTSGSEVGLSAPNAPDGHPEYDETESELVLDRAREALISELDLVRARHIAVRAIERLRVGLRHAALTIRNRSD